MPEYATYDAFFPSHGACASDKYSIHPCNHGIESLWVMPESQEGALGYVVVPFAGVRRFASSKSRASSVRMMRLRGVTAPHLPPIDLSWQRII